GSTENIARKTMDFPGQILENIDNPTELEKLYRKYPEAFREHFNDIYLQHSESMILQVWKARLFYEEIAAQAAPNETSNKTRDIVIIISLALFAGTFAKLPALTNW